MASHRPPRLSSPFHSFFFILRWLDNFKVPVFSLRHFVLIDLLLLMLSHFHLLNSVSPECFILNDFSLLYFSFCSYMVFLILLNCLFSYNSWSFLKIAILNSLLGKSYVFGFSYWKIMVILLCSCALNFCIADFVCCWSSCQLLQSLLTAFKRVIDTVSLPRFWGYFRPSMVHLFHTSCSLLWQNF